jgi:hypothetical protein
MSGIIDTVGSRSGVIGTTELDYEEGTFTPVVASWTASVNYAAYTKIGRVVTIEIHMAGTGGTAPSAYTAVTGLPFTTGRIGGQATLSAFIVDQSNSYKRFPAAALTPGNAASCTFDISLLENYESFTMANNDQLQIGGTYLVNI